MNNEEFRKDFLLRSEIILGELMDQIEDIKSIQDQSKIEDFINKFVNDVRNGVDQDIFDISNNLIKIRHFVEIYLKLQ